MTEGTDRRLRILFIPQWYPPRVGQTSVSGTFVREHVMASAQNDDVSVLIFRMSRDAKQGFLLNRYTDEGVEVIDVTVPSVGSRLMRRIRWFRSIITALAAWGRPDVIHTQDKLSFAAGRLAGLIGVPFVVSQHWTGFMRRVVPEATAANFRKSFKRAALILASNSDAMTDLAYYGIEVETTWFPNAFDPNIFYPPVSGKRQPYLLHVSGFSEQKRVKDIAISFSRVLEHMPDAHIHFVGDGIDMESTRKTVCDILPVRSFTFHGFLPKKEVAEMMRESCGFIFPSSFETFGCVLMEAMACGCPVLTTQAGGIPSAVCEGDGIIVDVGDRSAITEGMLRFLQGDHGLETERIAESAFKRFSREHVGKLIHDAYLKAVAGRKREC